MYHNKIAHDLIDIFNIIWKNNYINLTKVIKLAYIDLLKDTTILNNEF